MSANMDTIGDFRFVVRLHEYPTVWHLGNFEASEVLATLHQGALLLRRGQPWIGNLTRSYSSR